MLIKSGQKAFHIFLRVVVGLLSLALICFTAIPSIHSDAWWIRVFDFPRIQFAVMMALILAGYLVLHLWRRLHSWEYGLAAVVGLALLWQLIAIAPYTVFYPKQMSDSSYENDSQRISLLIFNVRYDNHQVDALRDLIQDTNPDLILLSETTHWWLEQLQGLEDDYPYTLLQPQKNDFGLLLYSRFELVNPEIRFLVESEVPSIRSQVRLPSGKLVTLYGVHPRPPGLKLSEEEEAEAHGDERADSNMRDAELMLVAKEIKKLGSVPVIVAGDFNDVAWSRTTHLFQRIGGLLDPRVGRGLVNTFDTRSRLFRYPLDHAFATQDFLLVGLDRMPDIGSDHFPLLVKLEYAPDTSGTNEKPQQDAGDQEEANKAIDQGSAIE